MKPHTLLVCIALALLGAVCALDPCTLDDFNARYTECTSDNTRDLVYYLKHNVSCYGGEQPPEPVYDLQCNIQCRPGNYLPLGTTSCERCPAGTFSIGGGYRIDSWFSWPSSLRFRRYTYNATNPKIHVYMPSGQQWSLHDSFLRSGNITDSHTSVLELSVYIAGNMGHVTFSYRVNAEGTGSISWDGIQFDLDGNILLAKTHHTNNYVTVTYPIGFGAHILSWSYIKDSSLSSGEDAAFINLIEIGGTSFADDFCEECLEGTYNPKTGATSCIPCPTNTYANTTGAATCSACPAGTYAFSESAQCIPSELCTEYDYEQYYSPCANGLRLLLSDWITPKICNSDAPDAKQLPLPQNGIECGECTDGAQRNPNTWQCEYCPDGTYSRNGSACLDCPAGTAAINIFAVDKFDDMIPGATTNCSGDCFNQGWEMHSSYMNSGVGHGSSVNSWLQFNVTLTSPGVLTFTYFILCPSKQCSLTLSTGNAGETDSVYATSTNKVKATVALVAGSHSLRWTFSKYDYQATISRNDAANIYDIFITHTTVGGAVECTKCSAGAISSANSKQCTPCLAGQQSNADGTQCESCPAGTFNPTPGSACTPCGAGTTSLPDRTGCDITCIYKHNNVTYDLNLLRSNSSYGPIADVHKQHYYINICSTQPHHCWATKTTQIDSYACQETPGKIAGTDEYEGKDIGHIFAWYPLSSTSSSEDSGVIMSFERGDLGCAASNNGQAKSRQTQVKFVCDPSAGTGYPVGDNLVENTPCKYDFVWNSLYACPVCSESDMGYYYTACQGGQRMKIWYFYDSPPRCHSGQLPESVSVACSESGESCPAGDYLSPAGECTKCRAGSFSVGGGERILSWDPLPPRFSQCTDSDCSPWSGGVDGTETISSGPGLSILTAVFDLVVPGLINFHYKLYSPNSGHFEFSIDGVEKLKNQIGANKLGWVNVNITLPKGEHTFIWTFHNGADTNLTTGRIGAVLKDVTIIGTDYHDDTCTPCPAGFKSAAGAAVCTPCGIDHFSPAPDSSQCHPCPIGLTSLAKSSFCEDRPVCTPADYSYEYSECSAQGTRVKTTVYADPQFCLGIVDLPLPEEVECAPCAQGLWYDPNIPGKCNACPDGQFLLEGECLPSPAGSVAQRKMYYFINNATSDNEFPEGFTTSCSGDCGSFGWRIRDNFVDSGYHASNGVDSWLKLDAKVSQLASVSFQYSVVSSSLSSLDVYIDSKFVVSLFGAGVHSVAIKEGEHIIAWNYHQHQGEKGHATLANVVLTGTTDAAAGGFIRKCPAGSYSNTGSSTCSLCPAGSYNPVEGADGCEPCTYFHYSATPGATHCLMCNGDSEAPEGSQFCHNPECSFTIESRSAYRTMFSLASTDVVGPLRVHNSSFYVNFCNASLTGTPCNPGRPSHVCADEDSAKKRDWGNYLDFSPMVVPPVSGSGNVSFELTFALGDSDGCPANVQRQAIFKFKCDVNANAGIAMYDPTDEDSDACTAVFVWTGALGCPVCQLNDYNQLLGPCVEGMRTVRNVRKSDCNGQQIIPEPSQSCSGTVEFPIAVVFVIIGVILALVVAAVIVFIKNRRITAQYGRLKSQTHSSMDTDNL